MKQRITVQQLNELTDEQKDRLRNLWAPEKGDFIYSPEEHKERLIREVLSKECFVSASEEYVEGRALTLLSIGQCIDLLKKRWTDRVNIDESLGKYRVRTFKAVVRDHASLEERIYESAELIDALWEAVALYCIHILIFGLLCVLLLYNSFCLLTA